MDEARLLTLVSYIHYLFQSKDARTVDRDEAVLPEDHLLHSFSFPVEMKPLASSIT